MQKIATDPYRFTRHRDGRRTTLAERLSFAPRLTRLATWPGNGKLRPRIPKAIPVRRVWGTPQEPSEQAKTRRAAKAAERQRGFTPVYPGQSLAQMLPKGFERDSAFRAANGIKEV